MDDDEYLSDLMGKVEVSASIGHNSENYLLVKERLFVDLIKGRDDLTSRIISEAKEIIRKGKLERLEYDVNVMGKALSELRINPETGERLSDENYGKLVSCMFEKLQDTKWFNFNYRSSCIWAYENPRQLALMRETYPNVMSLQSLQRKYRQRLEALNQTKVMYTPPEPPVVDDTREKYYEEQLKKHEESKRKAFEDAVADTLTGVKNGKISPEEAAKAAWEKSEQKRKEIEQNPEVVDLLAHIQSTKSFKVDVVSANFVASMEQLIHKFPSKEIDSNLRQNLSFDPINVKVPALHKMADILNALCEDYPIVNPNKHH